MKSLLIILFICGVATNAIAQDTTKSTKTTTSKTTTKSKTVTGAIGAKSSTTTTKKAPPATEKKQMSFAEMLRNADSSAATRPDSTQAPKQ